MLSEVLPSSLMGSMDKSLAFQGRVLTHVGQGSVPAKGHMRREGRRRAPSLSWRPCGESEAFALGVAMETVSPKEVHMARDRIVALFHLNFCLSSRE